MDMGFTDLLKQNVAKYNSEQKNRVVQLINEYTIKNVNSYGEMIKNVLLEVSKKGVESARLGFIQQSRSVWIITKKCRCDIC